MLRSGVRSPYAPPSMTRPSTKVGGRFRVPCRDRTPRGDDSLGLSSEEGGARRAETRPEGADCRSPYAPPSIQRLPSGRRFCCRCEALRHRTLPFSGSAAALRPAAPPLQGNLRHRRASRCLFGDLRDKNELSPERPIAGLTPGRLLLTFCGALQKSALLCLGQDSVFRFCHLAGIEPREGTTALGCRLRRAEPDVPKRDRGWIAACSWV